MSAYFDWWDGRERRALLLDGDRLIVGSAPESDVVVGDAVGVADSCDAASAQRPLVHRGLRLPQRHGGQRPAAHLVAAAAPERRGPAGTGPVGVLRQPSAGGNPTDAVIERPPITAREHDVLVVLCRPLANGDVFTEPATVREMAAALTVSENAVKLHLANLTAKFGVVGAERRRSRLANAALDAGAVTLADLRQQ